MTNIEILRDAHAHSTPGTWQKGKSTHETVTEKGYRIADFHHADDADFCDKAHNLIIGVLDEFEELKLKVNNMSPDSTTTELTNARRLAWLSKNFKKVECIAGRFYLVGLATGRGHLRFNTLNELIDSQLNG